MEPSPPVDLSGDWRAAEWDEGLRRSFPEPGFDDEAWEPVVVPGHWRSVPAFAASDGPLLYRRRFEAAPPPEGTRAWLVLDGVFYQGDVWLDGGYLGDTEGYFIPHVFDATEAVRARAEHVVGVEAACRPEADLRAKGNLTGVFQHWDCLDPDWNPGGIWRPLRLEYTGAVRIANLRVRCTEAGPRRAKVAVYAVLDSVAACSVRVRTTLAGAERVTEHPLAEGANLLEWTVTVADPALWWPHALGDQPLHTLRVEVDVDGATSHAVDRRLGLRSLSWRQWTLSVNGERLFLKGSNQGPNRMALGEAGADELAADVTLAREAGLDLLRLHAHISRPELYRAADEQGVLLWQDLPLQWGYSRGLQAQAERQARAAVDLLAHHPSIALWCAHNEPVPLGRPGPAGEQAAGTAWLRPLARVAAQQLPSWNRTVLDPALERTLAEADGTRRVLAHSGLLPRLGSGGGDSHLYFGWYYGDERGLSGLCRALPRLVRFVSEFGAQAVPTDAAFCEPKRWPDLEWERLARTHNLQKERFDRYVPPADFATFEEWQLATQDYQATLIKHHVETLRRLKYRPTGGFCHFAFADGHPGVTWTVLDHHRVPKAGYAALVEACRPVLVVAERPPPSVSPGDHLALDVHVVSDLRTALAGAVVEARLSWPGGDHSWRWQGDVPADECVRVGTVQCVVPGAGGALVLDLRLKAGEVTATNRYETVITPPH